MAKTETIKEPFVMYGGAVSGNFYPTSHMYKVTDLENELSDFRAKGVTTYIGIKDKSMGLVPWATEMAGLYLYDILQKGENITMLDVIEAMAQHTKIKEDASEVGKKMHEWCEYFIKHKMKKEGYEVAPELPADPQTLLGVNSFLEWYLKEPTEFISSERVVYSRKHKYIGTMDFEAIRNGKLIAGDFKSSNGLYNSVLAQLSAYVQASEEEAEHMGAPIKYEGRVVVRLAKESEEEYNTRMTRKKMIKGKEGDEFEPYLEFECKEFYGRDLHERDLNGFLLHKALFEWDQSTDFYRNK